MNLSLYMTTDSENVINKVLKNKHEISVKLKDTTNMSTPIIILSEIENINLLNYNYCFLTEFNRFYFIRDIEVFNSNMYRLFLECDVLESFKNDILNSECEIIRGLKVGEYFQNNSKTEVIRDIDIYKSDVTLDDEKNIILSTIGG